jgi:hypothetical protein
MKKKDKKEYIPVKRFEQIGHTCGFSPEWILA